MKLTDFCRSLPKNWATAPIYAAGVKLPNGKTAEGKSPLGRASKENLSPEFSAQWIERYPDQFKAVGVYTGLRSGGLVIFDVDQNLGAIQEKWSADLLNESTPRVLSPRPNAAKYLFMVPEADSLRVSGLSHAAAGQEGWEVLWGSQGVLCGAYKDEGHYTFIGDINAVPEAPEWLLEKMREQYRKLHDGKKSRRVRDSKYANRSREEKIAIAESCLSVIEPRGAFSERFWWEIGAMINSELPNEDGLRLWEEWSRRDIEYAHEWEAGKNPCADRWAAGFNGEGLGFGTLIHEADAVDPKRTRFKRDGLEELVEEIQAVPAKYRLDYLTPEELVARGLEIEETYENPAYANQAKTILAAEGGRMRDGAAAIDQLIDAHLSYERNKGFAPTSVKSLDDSPFDYLIPGILPRPWLLLVHADGGVGKSAMCQTLCKHISQGIPFDVHGANVPVEQGRCLWLNGDQSERVLRQQFEMIGCDQNIDVMSEWDMAWYRQFCKIQTKHHYRLVVIDSLDGCNDSNPYEENRREYALPLKKLARRNGVDFPGCSIIVIHHNNRNGGFRGTSAIKAAVDETWNMQRIEHKEAAELGLSFNSRLITVEKSRDGREGVQQVFNLLGDFTYRIQAYEKRIELDAGAHSHMLQLLKKMREDFSPCSIDTFVDHPTLGGKHRKRAIRYGLSKLENQGLIKRCPAPKAPSRGGRPPVYWVAVGTDIPNKGFSRAQERSLRSGVLTQTSSPGTDLKNNAVCQKPPVVKNSPGAPDKPESIYKPGVSTKPVVNQNPSSAMEEALFTDLHRLRGEAQNLPDWAMDSDLGLNFPFEE